MFNDLTSVCLQQKIGYNNGKLSRITTNQWPTLHHMQIIFPV